MKLSLKFTKPPKPPASKVSDRWPAEVAQQNRRITGVTPRVVRAFQESPAKFIPRSRGLLGRMAGKGAGKKEQAVF